MERKVRPGIQVWGISDVGMEREVNEDSFGYFEPESDQKYKSKGRLMLVCDGMGGAVAGDTASRMALQIINKEYYDAEGISSKEAIVRAIKIANAEIYKKQSQDKSFKGMGSTCVAAIIEGKTAFFAHVGDSRGYLVRDKKIFQITEDHSKVQEMVKRGWLSKEEAEDHPDKNILERVLGHRDTTDISVSPDVPLDEGYSILLCSDGLSNMIRDEEIEQVVSEGSTRSAANRLVTLANKRGGYDNITVMLANIGLRKYKRDSKARITVIPVGGKRTPVLLYGLLIAAILLGIAYHLYIGNVVYKWIGGRQETIKPIDKTSAKSKIIETQKNIFDIINEMNNKISSAFKNNTAESEIIEEEEQPVDIESSEKIKSGENDSDR